MLRPCQDLRKIMELSWQEHVTFLALDKVMAGQALSFRQGHSKNKASQDHGEIMSRPCQDLAKTLIFSKILREHA